MAPTHVGLGHLTDESLDFGRNLAVRLTTGVGPPSPEEAEAGAMPAQYGFWLDDDERVGPAGPNSGKTNPKRAVGGPQVRSDRGPTQGCQLLSQRQVLEGELGAGKEGAAKGAEETEQEGNHPRTVAHLAAG